MAFNDCICDWVLLPRQYVAAPSSSTYQIIGRNVSSHWMRVSSVAPYQSPDHGSDAVSQYTIVRGPFVSSALHLHEQVSSARQAVSPFVSLSCPTWYSPAYNISWLSPPQPCLLAVAQRARSYSFSIPSAFEDILTAFGVRGVESRVWAPLWHLLWQAAMLRPPRLITSCRE